MRKEWLQTVMDKHGYKTVDDLYAAVGYGGITTNKILFRLIELFKAELQKKPEIGQDAYIEIENTTKKRSVSKGVMIPGVENVLTHMAPCCMPVPGDDIIGYVTQGKGVTVHRIDCSNVRRYVEEGYHVLDVKWEKGYSGLFPARVDICAFDTANVNKIAADTVLALADMGIELVSLTPERDKNIIHVKLNVKNKDQLTAFINRMSSKAGVSEVYRR